eukprot:455527_1
MRAICSYKSSDDLSKELLVLTKALIQHQLSFNFPKKHSPIKSLSEYGKRMITEYFGNVKKYVIIAGEVPVNECVIDNESKMVQINLINSVFTNIDSLKVEGGINLQAGYMHHILSHVKNSQNTLKEIVVSVDQKSGLLCDRATMMSHYIGEFMKCGFCIHFRKYRFGNNKLYLVMQTESRAVTDTLMCSMVGSHTSQDTWMHRPEYWYDCDIDENIKMLSHTLIQNKLMNEMKQNHIDEQTRDSFDSYCKGITELSVLWKVFTSEKYNFLSKILTKHDGSMNLIAFTSLFENLEDITIYDSNLSMDLINHIYQYFKSKDKKSLKQILLIPAINAQLSVDFGIEIYSQLFHEINYAIGAVRYNETFKQSRGLMICRHTTDECFTYQGVHGIQTAYNSK